MANYMRGPHIKFPKKASRDAHYNAIRNACVIASSELGDGYNLKPEPITEGGILFVDWPGKKENNKGYKSVRLNMRWLWINEDGSPSNSLNNNPDAPVGPNSYNDRMCTFLKAFYGAPCFTRTELNAVCNALSNCFPGSKVVLMPTDASLQKDYQSNVAERFAKPHRLI